MKHLPFAPTPISVIQSNALMTSILQPQGGVKIKRDDLFLKCGGGSKARMLQYILADITPDKYDVIVTAGGPCSNFNRACALQCASLNIRMHLIVYTEHEEEFNKSNNFFLCKLSNVTITRCSKNQVVSTIAGIMEHYAAKGQRAKNIYGGGRCLEGIYAYYDSVEELANQIDIKSLQKVFVTCGTGTTTAGLMAGFQKHAPNVEIHAISVARKWNEEKNIISENIQLINKFSGSNYDMSNLIFHDEYIMGEYGATTPELIKFIQQFISSTGILIDPIYSGKALFGMSKLLKPTDTNVLFWHTGAIYTLLSNKSLFYE